jgi:hypothetical protein
MEDFRIGPGRNMYLMQRFRELGLDPRLAGIGLGPGDPSASVDWGTLKPQFAENDPILAAEIHQRFEDDRMVGPDLIEGLEDGAFPAATNFPCEFVERDESDGIRDLVALSCRPNYFKARHGRYIPVYPGEIWGWIEASRERSRHGEQLGALSLNIRPERRVFTEAMREVDVDFCETEGNTCPNRSIVYSPGGERRDELFLKTRCDSGTDADWEVCVRTDVDHLGGSSGGAITRSSSLMALGVVSLGVDCESPETCDDGGLTRTWNRYAEASTAFRHHARDNTSPVPKPSTDPPSSGRGDEYWASVSTSNLVGETSSEHTQVTLRCGYRGNYVNGLTAHMGWSKYIEEGLGIGGIAIHCRPDTQSTRNLLRLDTHQIHAAGGSDFLWDSRARRYSVTGGVTRFDWRYMAFRNLIYSNGPALPLPGLPDTYRRGQERLCGPGFALHGFASTQRDPILLRDLVDIECRDLTELPAVTVVDQGFDLLANFGAADPVASASNCGGELMVGVIVHRNPDTWGVTGIEPLCGGFDTAGITL